MTNQDPLVLIALDKDSGCIASDLTGCFKADECVCTHQPCLAICDLQMSFSTTLLKTIFKQSCHFGVVCTQKRDLLFSTKSFRVLRKYCFLKLKE